MKKLIVTLILLSLINGKILSGDNHQELLVQKLRELKTNLSLLFIAIRPSYEDHSTIAYFKYHLGCKTVVAFMTNGETLIEDYDLEPLNKFSANLRNESYNANSSLETELYYFCLPDVWSLPNYQTIEEQWNRENVLLQFSNLLNKYKPDIIILSKDYVFRDRSYINEYIINCLLELVESKFSFLSPFIFIPSEDNNKNSNLLIDLNNFKQSKYYNLAVNARKFYISQLKKINFYYNDLLPNYKCIYPRKNVKNVLSIIKFKNAYIDPSIIKEVNDLYDYTLTKIKIVYGNDNVREKLLVKIYSLIDKVERKLKSKINDKTKYLLIRLKSALEDLRCVLLEVKLRYKIDENILTNTQVAHLVIDTIASYQYQGITKLFFPAVESGWIINESSEKQHDYNANQEYRIISPINLNYHVPEPIYGIRNSEYEYKFQIILLHFNTRREKSFIYKENIPLKFAPRFTVEVINPVVYAKKDTQIVIKLTNNSRDGVSDYIYIDHPIVKSNKVKFALSKKGSFHIDTLFLKWTDVIKETEYTIPIMISDLKVEKFIVKNYEIKKNVRKQIYFVNQNIKSKLLKIFEQLGVEYKQVNNLEQIHEVENSNIIINKHTFSDLEPFNLITTIEKLLKQKNNLIFLPQNQIIWNKLIDFHGMRLNSWSSLDIKSDLFLDSSNFILKWPNTILKEDFNGWVNRLGVNEIFCITKKNTILAEFSKNPLLLQFTIENGKMIYANLDFSSQCDIIHKGAYKIFANLISLE